MIDGDSKLSCVGGVRGWTRFLGDPMMWEEVLVGPYCVRIVQDLARVSLFLVLRDGSSVALFEVSVSSKATEEA